MGSITWDCHYLYNVRLPLPQCEFRRPRTVSGLLTRPLAHSRCSINACGIKFPMMILRDKLPGFISGRHTPKHLRRKHVIVPGRERGSEREKGPRPGNTTASCARSQTPNSGPLLAPRKDRDSEWGRDISRVTFPWSLLTWMKTLK